MEIKTEYKGRTVFYPSEGRIREIPVPEYVRESKPSHMEQSLSEENVIAKKALQ